MAPKTAKNVEAIVGVALGPGAELMFEVEWKSNSNNTYEPLSKIINNCPAFEIYMNGKYESSRSEIMENNETTIESLQDEVEAVMSTLGLEEIRSFVESFDPDEFYVYIVHLVEFQGDEEYEAKYTAMYLKYLVRERADLD